MTPNSCAYAPTSGCPWYDDCVPDANAANDAAAEHPAAEVNACWRCPCAVSVRGMNRNHADCCPYDDVAPSR